MKKIKLKNLNILSNDLLKNDELRTVFGGYEESSGTYTVRCTFPGSHWVKTTKSENKKDNYVSKCVNEGGMSTVSISH
tara:strand:- start:36890 stop:37123 length:234 start_codon:yes stop_codon:yes gene_type:complete